MLRLQAVWIFVATMGTLYGQSRRSESETTRFRNDQDEAAIRLMLAEGYETSWNNHQPADAVTPDRCVDDAIFINTTGGWISGRQNFAELISRLHAPGGLFHDHTRRHVVEELRFIRPDVAVAVVKTFDIKRAGVSTTGEETRGLIIPKQREWALESKCVGEHQDSGNTGRTSLMGIRASEEAPNRSRNSTNVYREFVGRAAALLSIVS